MKRYLFIYRRDYHSLCDPDYELINSIEVEEHEFPAGATDWEVLLTARRGEVKDMLQSKSTASEGILNRALLRVVQIARNVPLDLPWEE